MPCRLRRGRAAPLLGRASSAVLSSSVLCRCRSSPARKPVPRRCSVVPFSAATASSCAGSAAARRCRLDDAVSAVCSGRLPHRRCRCPGRAVSAAHDRDLGGRGVVGRIADGQLGRVQRCYRRVDRGELLGLRLVDHGRRRGGVVASSEARDRGVAQVPVGRRPRCRFGLLVFRSFRVAGVPGRAAEPVAAARAAVAARLGRRR